MATPNSLYGQMLQDHQGQLPTSLDSYSDDQLKVMVSGLVDAWEALSVLQERAPTGLSITYDRIESWRERPNKSADPDYPIEEAVREGQIDAVGEDAVPIGCHIEWGQIYGARPIEQAPRAVLETELRSLHSQLQRLRVVFLAQAHLVGRILDGAIVGEESLYRWEEQRAAQAADTLLAGP